MHISNFYVNTNTVMHYSMGSAELMDLNLSMSYWIWIWWSWALSRKVPVLCTLKTNSSCRRMASVLKPPSQMLGLELGLEGLDFCGGRWGRLCRSCFRGSDGGCRRGGGAVVSNRVGWGFLSGGPGIAKRTDSPALALSACVSDRWYGCRPCASFNKQDMQEFICKSLTWAFTHEMQWNFINVCSGRKKICVNGPWPMCWWHTFLFVPCVF